MSKTKSNGKYPARTVQRRSRNTNPERVPRRHRPHVRRVVAGVAGAAAPKEGAPNVLFIVQDDTGFGQLGCYGSPIATPNLDALAKDGLRFKNMHTTALCSPTRSCILTGRNHHSNAMSCITEGSTGYPGRQRLHPVRERIPLGDPAAERLQHLCARQVAPDADRADSAAGPYDRWPLGRGFERYYGFLGGDTHQYYPELVYDNHPVEPEKTPEEGYHLTRGPRRQGEGFIADAKQVAPEQAVLHVLLPGAMHAPHHVPKEWADKYKGKFDDGWDVYREKMFARQKELGIIPKNAELSRHDPDVQDWNKLPADERKLYARMMEVFAGFLEHTDHYIGELFEFLKSIGECDNTLIMFISDNGASAEGGPNGSVNENKFFNNVPDDLQQNLAAIDDIGGPKYFNHYPWGWTLAGNTPFRRWKRETYRGGSQRSVHRPLAEGHQGQGRDPHAVRHAIDMVPTVLDALGIEPPTPISGVTQSPIEGLSFADVLRRRQGAAQHITQYFEMFGHRSLYHDGWRAVCPWPGTSFTESGLTFGAPIDYDKLTELDAKDWELYNIDKDFAENNNLAEKDRDRLIEMIGMWYVEAGKYNVLPIDSRGTLRFADARPQIAVERKNYVYYPGHADRCRPTRRRASSTCRTQCRCTPIFPRAAPRACCSPWAATTAASRSTSRTASSLRLQLRRRPALQGAVERRACPKATTSSASSSSPPASPTSPRARACRRTSSCSSTASRSDRRPAGDHSAVAGSGGRRVRRRRCRLAGDGRTTSRRSRSPAR